MGSQFTSSKVLEVTWFACSLRGISQEVVSTGSADTSATDVLVGEASWLLTKSAGSNGARGDLVVWACTTGTVVEELLTGKAYVGRAGLGILPLGVGSTCLAGTIGCFQNLVGRADILGAGELAGGISH